MITINQPDNSYDVVLNCDTQQEQENVIEAVTNGLAYVCAWNQLENFLIHLSEFNGTAKAEYLIKFMKRVLEEVEE